LYLQKNHLTSEAAKELLLATETSAPSTEKSRAVGLLGVAYTRLREKVGITTPEDAYLLRIRDILRQNQVLSDSAIVFQKRQMLDAEMRIEHPDSATLLIDMLDGCGLALAGHNDARSVDMIFEAGNASRAIGDFGRAINYYKRVASNKTDLTKAASSQFLIAFVFENDMQAYPQAKAAYETFLAQFPKSEMATDATIALKHLGRSPEEMIREFTKNPKN
jgi:tetratricopeptide (TPR) repeat protein